MPGWAPALVFRAELHPRAPLPALAGAPALGLPRCCPVSPCRPPLPPPPRFKAVSAKSKEDLVSQGFTEFTIEDFHNTVSPAIAPSPSRPGWGWG